MKLIGVLFSALLVTMVQPSSAVACSYPPRVSFPEALPASQHVFVFQIVSAAVVPAVDSTRIVAKIRIVESLKGSPRYTHVAYSNRWCGGNRLDVGHFFVIATSQTGSRLELEPADRNVLDITRAYYERNPTATQRAGLLPAIKRALTGSALPDYFHDRSLEGETQTFTVPPPPPPPANKRCTKRCGA